MGKEKVVYFFAGMVQFKMNFLDEFHSAATYMITLHHNNVQVTIFVMCLNFAGTGA